MKSNRQMIISIVVETITAMLFICDLVLEAIYIFLNKITFFVAIESIVPALGFYVLLTLMQSNTQLWNIFIPVTAQNNIYALYLAKGLKMLFCAMTLYTAICDLFKMTAMNYVFWIFLILALVISIYCKYKMWIILKKNRPKK